jgi:hypothetical protein
MASLAGIPAARSGTTLMDSYTRLGDAFDLADHRLADGVWHPTNVDDGHILSPGSVNRPRKELDGIEQEATDDGKAGA